MVSDHFKKPWNRILLWSSIPYFIYPYNSCSSRDTFIEREPGESANDRNDRAIRVAVKWYSQHLKTFESDTDGLKVVLLTNDQGNKQKAQDNGLLVYKCNVSHFQQEKTF